MPTEPEPTADLGKALVADDGGDYGTALQQWRLLAPSGIAEAENNLGLMYQRGRGVPADPAQAADWYRCAAEAGLANAQENLGGMFSKGAGVPKNDAKAVVLFRLAAKQGQLDAQYNLGVKYATGSSVANNPRECASNGRSAIAAEQPCRIASADQGQPVRDTVPPPTGCR